MTEIETELHLRNQDQAIQAGEPLDRMIRGGLILANLMLLSLLCLAVI